MRSTGKERRARLSFPPLVKGGSGGVGQKVWHAVDRIPLDCSLDRHRTRYRLSDLVFNAFEPASRSVIQTPKRSGAQNLFEHAAIWLRWDDCRGHLAHPPLPPLHKGGKENAAHAEAEHRKRERSYSARRDFSSAQPGVLLAHSWSSPALSYYWKYPIVSGGRKMPRSSRDHHSLDPQEVNLYRYHRART